MLKMNVHVILRLALGAAVAIAFAAAPQLAQAQAPGSLAQLASPDNCVQASDIEEGDCNGNTAGGLSGADDVVTSPDGSDVYVISSNDDAIAEFSRGDNGALSYFGCIADSSASDSSTCDDTTANGLVNPQAIAISPDGNNVYVAARDSNGNGTIAEFARNFDGTLTQLSPNDCIGENTGGTSDGVASDCANQSGHGIEAPDALAISPDGQNIYAVDSNDADIAEFTRNSNTGSLSQLNGANDCITEQNDGSTDCGTTDGTDLFAVDTVTVSPDGANVYTGNVTSEGGPGGITEFTRNFDGSLTELGCVQEQDDSNECGDDTAIGIGDVTSLAVSPDGGNVYAASSGTESIAEFGRSGDGSLSQLASPNDCITEQGSEEGCGTTDGRGLSGAFGVTVSPDGASVYVASESDDCCDAAIAEFARASDGSLAQLASPDNCIDEQGEDCGNDGGTSLGGGELAISPDGSNVYVIGQGSDVSEFSRVPVTHTLTVSLAGSGSGSVSDGGGGISCPSTCSNSYQANSFVDLTAAPSAGSTFSGWSGACSGTGFCQVQMSDDMAVTATFTPSSSPPPTTHTLTVELAGTGTGVVSDGTGDIACLPTCSHAYTEGAQVTLTATPASGSTFTGWSGDCSGTGTCQVTMNADMAASATFISTSTPTAGVPAPVLTAAPNAVTDSGAGFQGSADPEGLPTTVYFQYGLDKHYTQPGTSGPNYTGQTASQTIGSDFADHVVGPLSVSGLVPNALYHVRLVATNSAGTTYGQDVTFTTALAPLPGAPTMGQTFNIAPVSGVVLIYIHGHLVPLTQLEQIGPNVALDTRHGVLNLTINVGGGGPARDGAHATKVKTQTGQFGGAVFKLRQATKGSNAGLTTVMMTESAFKGAPSQAICKAPGSAADAQAAALNTKVIQLLHASAHGKFATSGRYSAATVRGTIWDTIARCDGTLIKAIKDEVSVTDFIRHKTILLHAGQSYLAPGPGHK